MTSRENLEAVRRSIEAVNAGELDSMLSVLATDAEWRVAEEHPESRTCRGHEEIRSYLAEWLTQLNDLRFEPAELVERGDRVIASGYLRGTGAGSGVEVEVPLAIVFTWRDGKVIRGEEYLGDACFVARLVVPRARELGLASRHGGMPRRHERRLSCRQFTVGVGEHSDLT